jgi:hypothetical protein
LPKETIVTVPEAPVEITSPAVVPVIPAVTVSPPAAQAITPIAKSSVAGAVIEAAPGTRRSRLLASTGINGEALGVLALMLGLLGTGAIALSRRVGNGTTSWHRIDT